MPYVDPEAQLAYQREWIKKRRLDWIAENGPCVDCGTWENLEVDHVDASQKVTHRIWSWSKARRDAELAKCAIRCIQCHDIKTVSSAECARGEQHVQSVLTSEQVREVRKRVANGESQTVVGKDFGVNNKHIWDLVHYRTRIYE